MKIVDPTKRIEAIGSFGDAASGWYWQSDTIPPVAEMQGQHDGLAQALRKEGVEVVMLDGEVGSRLKSCYTRDSVVAVKGGAIVCRMAPRIRRGEELTATKTLAKLGVPILRTLHGTATMEGGSFAWLNPKTAVIGRSIRVNEEGAAQVGEVLRHQGVELICVDLYGYQIHIDGAGFLTSQAVVLSTNQIVNMPILTWPDIITMIVVLGVVAMFAVMRQRRGSRTASTGGQAE